MQGGGRRVGWPSAGGSRGEGYGSSDHLIMQGGGRRGGWSSTGSNRSESIVSSSRSDQSMGSSFGERLPYNRYVSTKNRNVMSGASGAGSPESRLQVRNYFGGSESSQSRASSIVTPPNQASPGAQVPLPESILASAPSRLPPPIPALRTRHLSSMHMSMLATPPPSFTPPRFPSSPPPSISSTLSPNADIFTPSRFPSSPPSTPSMFSSTLDILQPETNAFSAPLLPRPAIEGRNEVEFGSARPAFDGRSDVGFALGRSGAARRDEVGSGLTRPSADGRSEVGFGSARPAADGRVELAFGSARPAIDERSDVLRFALARSPVDDRGEVGFALARSPVDGHDEVGFGLARPTTDARGELTFGSAPNLLGSSFRTAPLGDREHHQPRLVAEGLAEILLALDRVERDEDLTYEQLLMLEATLLFGGMGLHDQHSDMRLDVDDMSYEELLALEERIGNVSTGLTMDDVNKRLKRKRYSSQAAFIAGSQESDIKCSVCQEEYEDGDELGRIDCGHSYHIPCIKQWLVQKNQCPICKASALS